jgi:hypothetical protein
MKTSLIVLCSLLTSLGASAQESVAPADAIKAAALAYLATTEITDAPLAVDPDLKNAFALKGGNNLGLMLIPETKLAKELEHAREGITPIGQLWLKDLLPGVNGAAISSDKLRTISVSDGSNSMLLPILYLGVQGSGAAGKELVALSQDKTPLFTIALKSIDQTQKQPLEMTVVANEEKKMADVTLNIAGKWQGTFTVSAN